MDLRFIISNGHIQKDPDLLHQVCQLRNNASVTKHRHFDYYRGMALSEIELCDGLPWSHGKTITVFNKIWVGYI